VHRGRVATLVHARRNMHLVACDQLPNMDNNIEVDSVFESVLEAVVAMEEQEQAQAAARARTAVNCSRGGCA
jgi:predicted ATPase